MTSPPELEPAISLSGTLLHVDIICTDASW